MVLDLKLGGMYEIPEMRMVGYKPDRRINFQTTELIEKYGKEAIVYVNKNERRLIVRDESGLFKVIASYNPTIGQKARILRED